MLPCTLLHLGELVGFCIFWITLAFCDFSCVVFCGYVYGGYHLGAILFAEEDALQASVSRKSFARWKITSHWEDIWSICGQGFWVPKIIALWESYPSNVPKYPF